ncbi:helix-turn-helix domain-containing protein [Xanthobacter sediminis]
MNSSGDRKAARQFEYHETPRASRTAPAGAGPQPEDARARSNFAGDKFAWLETIALDHRLPSTATKVAVALGRYLNWATRAAHPSVSTLAGLLNLSENSVRAALRALSAAGHLVIEVGGGRGRANLYRMVTPTIAEGPRKGCSEAEGLGDAKPETLQVPVSKGFSRLHPNNCVEQSNLSGFAQSEIQIQRADDGFERFWTAFPKHEGRTSAASEYRRAVRTGTDPTLLLAGARHYANTCSGRPQQYVARAANWLARGDWEEYPLSAPHVAVQAPPVSDEVRRAVDEARRQGARRDQWVFVPAESPAWSAWRRAFRHAGAALAAPRAIFTMLPDNSTVRRQGAYFPTLFPPELP